MGLEFKGQVCVMIHSGSRGLGHQVATDALVAMEKAMGRDGIQTNDRQLACARINSSEGKNYLAAMAAAANYAWVNRSSMTFLARQAFAKQFDSTPDDLGMAVVYDVSHNIAKIEEHMVDGKPKTLCVHRKGATRAFPPHHPLIPVDYQFTGQPVLIGGTMGTCSYVLTGTEKGMAGEHRHTFEHIHTFGSSCHPVCSPVVSYVLTYHNLSLPSRFLFGQTRLAPPVMVQAAPSRGQAHGGRVRAPMALDPALLANLSWLAPAALLVAHAATNLECPWTMPFCCFQWTTQRCLMHSSKKASQSAWQAPSWSWRRHPSRTRT